MEDLLREYARNIINNFPTEEAAFVLGCVYLAVAAKKYDAWVHTNDVNELVFHPSPTPLSSFSLNLTSSYKQNN